MKQKIKEIEKNVVLYRDDKNGIAWIEDGRTGLGISVHPNISATGSVRGMRKTGLWGKTDRVVRSHGWIYNIDRLAYDPKDPLERIVMCECQCQGCIERRGGIYLGEGYGFGKR